MKTKKEIKKWLLENCINKYGDLDLSKLDFSEFDGNVIINKWKVKHNLHQDSQEVTGNLYQERQKVKGNLTQYEQKVDQNLFQDGQKVKGNIWQHNQQFKGILYDQDTSDLEQLTNYWSIAYKHKEKTK